MKEVMTFLKENPVQYLATVGRDGKGTRRFGELRKALGNISTKVLTSNLRSMEDDSLLTRQVYPEVPPKVEYTLTDLGYSLKPILLSMVEWGTQLKIPCGQVA